MSIPPIFRKKELPQTRPSPYKQLEYLHIGPGDYVTPAGIRNESSFHTVLQSKEIIHP
jgi:hypothetical protein